MRATRILLGQFERDLSGVHLARLRLVFEAVVAAARSKRLTLTGLGRAMAGRTTHKHGIKRVDRLLGNARLHSERLAFFRALAKRIVAPRSRPTIIVDWTAITPGIWALVAAVSFEGRALIVYAEAHPISRYLKPQVNRAFLHQLSSVLPPCRPVIVADAGFRSPFMKLVLALGWDYVIRLRGPAKIRHQVGKGWSRLTFLFGQVSRVRDFGTVQIGIHAKYETRLVGFRHKVWHRKYWARVRRGSVQWRERRAAYEPWILATSMQIEPRRLGRLYARRMQIEETFRDTKSPRFGLCLASARTRSVDRANVLLLLAAFAHLFAILVGVALENTTLARGFQANTTRTARVLSLATVGTLAIAALAGAELSPALRRTHWLSLQRRLAEAVAF